MVLQMLIWTGGRPKTYYTGPDFERMSLRSQQRHRAEMKGQQRLNKFLTDHSTSGTAHTIRGSKSLPSLAQLLDPLPPVELDALSISEIMLKNPVSPAGNETSFTPSLVLVSPSLPEISQLSPPVAIRRTRSATVLSDPSDHEDQLDQNSLAGLDNADLDDCEDWWDLSNEEDEDYEESHDDKLRQAKPLAPEAQEAWEDELDELMDSTVDAERSWSEIRAEVDAQLKKNFKHFGRTEVNQLIILRSFATLLMKGYGKVEASKRIAEQWRDGEGLHFSR
jgi:hypothetical protein